MRCWYCLKAEMVEVEDGVLQWLKCPKCGATHTDIPEPKKFGLARERNDASGATKYKAHLISEAEKKRLREQGSKWKLGPIFPSKLRGTEK